MVLSQRGHRSASERRRNERVVASSGSAPVVRDPAFCLLCQQIEVFYVSNLTVCSVVTSARNRELAGSHHPEGQSVALDATSARCSFCIADYLSVIDIIHHHSMILLDQFSLEKIACSFIYLFSENETVSIHSIAFP